MSGELIGLMVFVDALGVGVVVITYVLLGRHRDLNAASARLADEIRDEVDRAERVLRQLDARLGFAERKISE